MSPIGMTLLLVLSLGLFAWSAWQRWRLMMTARAPAQRADRVGERIRSVLVFMFGQARMPRYFWAGVAHIVVFFGFLVLLLNSILLWIRGYDYDFTFWGLLALDHPVGATYAFLRDIFTVLVILGVAIFFWNRLVLRLKRLTINFEGVLILTIILVMMLADLVYEGGEINLYRGGEFVAAMPFASVTANLMDGLSESATRTWWHVGFWVHGALVLIFLNLLPYGKHFHVLTVLPNVFARELGPSGRVPPIEDIEGRLEREETLGVRRVKDLSWKDVLDLYTCTECGRCSDHCPATSTGKLLSPKHLTIALRDHMYFRKGQLTGAGGDGATDGDAAQVEPPGRPHGIRDKTMTGDASADAVRDVPDFVPAWVNPEVLWACTTCGACEQECPVFITYIDKIVGMRRHLAMESGEFPEQLATMFQGLERVGNPYSFANEERANWAEGLDVPLRADKPDAEWLYWVGCAPSFDDRSRKIARATAELLKEAGIDFAILGPEEMCNGDPARRAGNEYLFEILARQNIETMNGYSVKKVIATCPHCFHTLKNEYPDFGGQYEVVHHSQLLSELVRTGRLKPRHEVRAKIAYHDACYLGRHNDVYEAPREALAAIPGVELRTPAESRDRGMCCGAGGAQMWKEEEPGDARVNHTRVKQILKVLPNTNGDSATIAAACPFCMTMLRDGVLDQNIEGVETLDIAEVLHRSVFGAGGGNSE